MPGPASGLEHDRPPLDAAHARANVATIANDVSLTIVADRRNVGSEDRGKSREPRSCLCFHVSLWQRNNRSGEFYMAEVWSYARVRARRLSPMSV